MWQKNELVDNTYTIAGELGQGGLGEIYLAYHNRLQKYVVLKKIKDKYANVLRVRTEVDILKRLHHTFLPQVYDFIQSRYGIYTVMDYIPGYDLDKYLKSGYRFDENQIVTWLLQMCEVLNYIHKGNPRVLHCDIKPGNIIITEEGNICLIDFNVSTDEILSQNLSGLSKMYSSPEQFQKSYQLEKQGYSNIILGPGTDIYSTGATFYQMMSGYNPSPDGRNIPLSELNTGYSPELCKIIDKMMSYRSGDRYSSAADVTRAVNRIYKRDRAGRNLLATILISSAIYFAVVLLGVTMILGGNVKEAENTLVDRLEKLSEIYESGDYKEAIKEGLEILNDTDFEDILKKGSSRKAEILSIIGDSLFYSEDYKTSLDYYKEALELEKNGNNYRNYIVALIRAGRKSDAEAEMKEAEKEGISGNSLSIIDAEFAYSEGNYEKALAYLTNIRDDGDKDIKERAYLLSAYIYDSMLEYDKSIESFEGAAALNGTASNYRMLGNEYIKKANSTSINDVAGRKKSFASAAMCYEKVVSSDYFSAEDSINFAICLKETGKIEDAVKVMLMQKQKSGGENYRVEMYLAFIYEDAGNYLKAAEEAAEAIREYENTSGDKRESIGSDNIKHLYEIEKIKKKVLG